MFESSVCIICLAWSLGFYQAQFNFTFQGFWDQDSRFFKVFKVSGARFQGFWFKVFSRFQGFSRFLNQGFSRFPRFFKVFKVSGSRFLQGFKVFQGFWDQVSRFFKVSV